MRSASANAAYPSLPLRALVLNGVLVGLAIWAVSWMTDRRRASTGRPDADATVCDETPDATIDGPFMLGATALVLAAILIPEARLILYNAFARADFSHSRLSIVALLPQAALVTIFAHRLLAAGQRNGRPWTDVRSAAFRWLAAGLVLGVVLWLARELLVSVAVTGIGAALETPPWRLLTSEVVRLGVALLLIVVVALGLVRRAPVAALTLAGGLLIAWTASEALYSADYRLSGPHTRRVGAPFDTFSYLNAPPGTLRPPTAEERAAVNARLETDAYRTVLTQDEFPAIVEPDLAMFWGLRLVEGYPNLSRRLAMLPWAPGMTSLRQVDIGSTSPDQMPWRLLAALNVKYVLQVDRSFWFNPAPGGPDPPVDPARLQVLVNPEPVTPRVFFASTVAPIGRVPRLSGDRGDRPPPRNPPITPPEQRSVVEGISRERRYPTDGDLTATFDQDRVLVQVEPSDEARFLVVNEMYHPAWRAWVDGTPAEIYPTNLVMRGVVVPAGATTVELRYVPFIVSPPGIALFVAALAATLACWWGLGRYARARCTRRHAGGRGRVGGPARSRPALAVAACPSRGRHHAQRWISVAAVWWRTRSIGRTIVHSAAAATRSTAARFAAIQTGVPSCSSTKVIPPFMTPSVSHWQV